MPIKFTKHELKSPEFVLPPIEHAVDIIRCGLFNWEAGPWNEFKQIREIKVFCVSCSKTFDMKWPINTTNLRRHYNSRHGRVTSPENADENMVANMVAKDDVFDIKPIGSSTSELSSESNRSISTEDSSQKRPLSLEELVAIEAAEITAFDLEHITDLLLVAIAKHNLPFGLFDYPEMKAILSHLSKKNTKPSCHDLCSRLDVLYTKEVNRLKNILAKNSSRFAITIDKSSLAKKDRIFAVTLHFLNALFNLEKHYIGFEVLKEQAPTGFLLYQLLTGVLKEYGIGNRLISITSKNTSSLDYVLGKYFEYQRLLEKHDFQGGIPCVATAFDLCIDVFLRYTFFKPDTSKEFQRLLNQLKKSNPLSEDTAISMRSLPDLIRQICNGVIERPYLQKTFNQIVEETGPSPSSDSAHHTLLRENKHSWISTYDMVDRFLEFRGEITELLKRASYEDKQQIADFQAWYITESEWEYLAQVRDFLSIFQQAIKMLQTTTSPTISLVVPLIDLVMKDVESFDCRQNHVLKFAVAEVRKKLSIFFPIHEPKNDTMKTFFVATVLDPRFKLKYFEELHFTPALIERVKRSFYQVYSRYKWEFEKERKWTSNGAVTSTSVDRRKCRKVDTSQTTNEPELDSRLFPSKRINLSDQNEADLYLSEAREYRTKSWMDYYKENEHVFPVICRMARDFLAIPPISVPAENLYSHISDVFLDHGSEMELRAMKTFAVLKARGIITDEARVDFFAYGERKSDERVLMKEC